MKLRIAAILISLLVGVFGCAGRAISVQPASSGIELSDTDSHALLTEVLIHHVRDARVNYEMLCEDLRLETYLGHLAATDPAMIIDDRQRMAFWINAYNAFTLKVVCDNYPIDSINDLHFGGLNVGVVLHKTIWDREFIIINGLKMSLNHIEHEILRKEFQDPRVHFALVCASISCPPLRSEAFEGGHLETQLNEQARQFMGDTSRNSFDTVKLKASISKIFDWYGGDFGADDSERLVYLSQFLDHEVAESIRARADEWDVGHQDYDWGLNQ